MLEKYIDYTILKADAKCDDIEKLCAEAKAAGCASVCVNPAYVSLAKSLLKGSTIKVCTVVGFPLGMTLSQVKVCEAEQAIKNGAAEIDMVIPIGFVKSGLFDDVRADITAVNNVCKKNDVILKVIIETCLLTDREKREVSKIIADVGADFVKTSTGFSTAGATIEDVKLIRETVGNRTKIKASGGIRDADFGKKLIDAGANRIGSSKLF